MARLGELPEGEAGVEEPIVPEVELKLDLELDLSELDDPDLES